MDELQEILAKPNFEKFVYDLDYDQKWLLFATLFDSLGADIVKHTEKRGFDPKNLDISKMLMNQVSEIAEAHEAYRCNDAQSDKIPEFSGLEEEEADVILRVMIDSSAKGWRTSAACIAKDKYNQNRPPMHGGKKF